MKIQLLIANSDSDYAAHLSQVLTERYADMFEVCVCSSAERLRELTGTGSFDAALLDPAMAAPAVLRAVKLPLLLWDGSQADDESLAGLTKLRKYQRISTMVGEVLEQCAALSAGAASFDSSRARITVAWSPSGGSGKTTVALAYAAKKATEGRRTVYLDLEPFSSTGVYFEEQGKSISTAFEKLDGNAALLLQGIRQTDPVSGIGYFCRPTNYDDISILNEDDLTALIAAAGAEVNELVIDLGSGYDRKTALLLERADRVLLPLDGSRASLVKWEQFRTQHDLYERIRGKLTLVGNKGFKGVDPQWGGRALCLPPVQSADPVQVFRALSGADFG